MSVHVSWKLQNRIILVTFSGEISLADYASAAHSLRTTLQTTPEENTIHYILHFKADATYKKDALRLKSMTDFFRANLLHGWLVIVQDKTSPIMTFLSSTAAQIVRAQFRSITTLPEADIFLRHVDRTLLNDPADTFPVVLSSPALPATKTPEAVTVEDPIVTAITIYVPQVNASEIETQEMRSLQRQELETQELPQTTITPSSEDDVHSV